MPDSAWISHDPDSNTLLLSAGRDFLLDLARLLAEMELEGADARDLTALPGLEVRADFRLILDRCIREDGLRAESDVPPMWRLSFSDDGWIEAAEKVEVVACASGAGHCYIGAIGPDDVTIVVSKGEY